jgi:hypothetical protein
MSLIRSLCIALTLAFCVACGGSKDTTPASSGSEAVDQTFTGTLSDGSLVTLSFGTSGVSSGNRRALSAAPRSGEAAGAVTVTGSITRPDGATVALTGTYDPATKSFSIQGGGYVFSGTYASGVIQADCTVDGTPVKLVAMMGAASAITRYCGEYATAANETGYFNLVVSGSKAFGVHGGKDYGGGSFSGTVSGAEIAMSDAEGTVIKATISGSGVTGTFTNSDGTGTFSGSVEICEGILKSAVTCTELTYSEWTTCSSEGTQTRTVASALPAGCSGGTPVVTQSCVPPPATSCELPGSNPADSIYNTLTTTATAPAAAGGTIADGIYYRTVKTKFGQTTEGPDNDGGLSQFRVVVSGSTVDVLATDDGSMRRFLATPSVAGTTLTLTVTCSTDPENPVGSTLSLGFTATESELRIYGGDNSEEVLTKQ